MEHDCSRLHAFFRNEIIKKGLYLESFNFLRWYIIYYINDIKMMIVTMLMNMIMTCDRFHNELMTQYSNISKTKFMFLFIHCFISLLYNI